jgi:hypothetical protein
MDDTTIVYPELSVLVRRHLAWYTETKVESWSSDMHLFFSVKNHVWS